MADNTPATIIRSFGDKKVDDKIFALLGEFDHKLLGTPVEGDNYVSLLSGEGKKKKAVNVSLFIRDQYIPAERVVSGGKHPSLCRGDVKIDGQLYGFHITWSPELGQAVFVSCCTIDGVTLIVCTDFKLWVNYRIIDTDAIDAKIRQALAVEAGESSASPVDRVDLVDQATNTSKTTRSYDDSRRLAELKFPVRFDFPYLGGLEFGRHNVVCAGEVSVDGNTGTIVDGACDCRAGAIVVLVKNTGIDGIYYEWMILVWDREANKPALIGSTDEVICILHEFEIVINGRVLDPYVVFADHQTPTSSQSPLEVSDCFESDDGLPSPSNLPEDPRGMFGESETDSESEFYGEVPVGDFRSSGLFNPLLPSAFNVERRDFLNRLNALLADRMKEVEGKQVVIRNGDDPVAWGVVAFCGPILGINVTWLKNPDAEPVFVALKISADPFTMTGSAIEVIAPSARYGTICLSDCEGYSNLTFRFVDSDVDNVRQHLNYEFSYMAARLYEYPSEELARRSDTHRSRFEWRISEGRREEEWEEWSDHIPYTSDSEYF